MNRCETSGSLGAMRMVLRYAEHARAIHNLPILHDTEGSRLTVGMSPWGKGRKGDLGASRVELKKEETELLCTMVSADSLLALAQKLGLYLGSLESGRIASGMMVGET